MATLNRAELLDALRALAQVLNANGTAAGIQIVGGAALALEYFERAATRDVDAFLYPAEPVLRAAKQVASERGYPEDWVNDAVKMYAPDYGDPQWKLVLVEGDVVFSVAPADLLLAMKLRAGRGRRDAGDIAHLLELCAVRSVGHAIEIFETYYPHDSVSARALIQLRRRFPDDSQESVT